MYKYQIELKEPRLFKDKGREIIRLLLTMKLNKSFENTILYHMTVDDIDTSKYLLYNELLVSLLRSCQGTEVILQECFTDQEKEFINEDYVNTINEKLKQCELLFLQIIKRLVETQTKWISSISRRMKEIIHIIVMRIVYSMVVIREGVPIIKDGDITTLLSGIFENELIFDDKKLANIIQKATESGHFRSNILN